MLKICHFDNYLKVKELVGLKDIQKLYPGKKVTYKGGRIILSDKSSTQRKGTGKTKFSYINMEKTREMQEKAYQEGKIYIPYEVMSSKNSRTLKYVRKTGSANKVPLLVHSPQYDEYVILSKQYWKKDRDRFLEMVSGCSTPYRIGFFFHRTTKGRFDYPNMMQGVMDLMVEHEWLEDDCADIIMPIPLGYMVDKEIQGIIISMYGTKKEDL